MQYKYLESRPERASGALTSTGTRIRVAHLFKLVTSGMSYQQLQTEWYPQLSVATLRGAVEEARAHHSLPATAHA